MSSTEKKIDQEQVTSPEGAASQPIDYEKEGKVPPQYQGPGMNSEVVEEMWTLPTMADPKRNAELIEWRRKGLESLRQEESDRESQKETGIRGEYQHLTSEEKASFVGVQKEIGESLGDLIKLGVGLNGSPEENFVLAKMHAAYVEAQEEWPGRPITVKFGRDIDKRVFANLVRKMTLSQLGVQRKAKDQARLEELKGELGIPDRGAKVGTGGASTESALKDSGEPKAEEFKTAFEAISGGFAEAGARKAKEYDERIRALRAGKPLKDGEKMDDLLAGFRRFTHKEWREDVNVGKVNQERKTATPAESGPLLSTAERKKLTGLNASWELAKVAKQRGVDLAKLSREEYAQFAIDESLAIDDDQLRGPVWARMATSAVEVVARAKELRGGSDENAVKAFKKSDEAFKAFEDVMKAKAGQADRYLSDGVRVRQGTETSQSWLYFGINGSVPENRPETFKAYVSFKDLSSFRPEKFTAFMSELQATGFNGDVKIFQDLNFQAMYLNDQVVMHGASKKDAELAMQTAERFFGSDLASKGTGKDETINGESLSYSQILARKIKEAIDKKKA